MTNPDLVELAMRMVQGASTQAGTRNSFAVTSADHAHNLLEPTPQGLTEVEEPPTLPKEQGSAGLTRIAPAKEKKAADELAAMILDDLSRVEGYPSRGVRVTVYGSNPWNSWLSFGADAGPVPNKADLQNFCEIITERLKQLYEI